MVDHGGFGPDSARYTKPIMPFVFLQKTSSHLFLLFQPELGFFLPFTGIGPFSCFRRPARIHPQFLRIVLKSFDLSWHLHTRPESCEPRGNRDGMG
jgi:hypothetical protein